MRKLLSASALALALMAGTATAGSNTGNLAVSATTTNACFITGGAINFGDFPAYAHTNIDVVGNVAMDCSANTAYSIAKSVSGSNSLSGPGGSLSYSIYTDAARTTLLTNTTGVIAGDSGVGGSLSIPLYARIAQGVSTGVGAKTGTVQLTVTF